MNIDRVGLLSGKWYLFISFLGYTVYIKCRQQCKLESNHTTLKRSPANACRNQYVDPTVVKSVSSLLDPDSNPDTARLGVQRVLSADAAPSVSSHPKGK